MPKWEPLKNKPNTYRYKNNGDKKYKYGVRKTYQLDGQKRKEFTKSGLKSASDAKVVLDKFNADLYADKIKPENQANMTIGQCYEEMKELKFKSGKWRKTTVHVSNLYFKKYIKNVFSDTKISKMNRADYQTFINSLADRGLSKAYIEDINGLYQSIMNYAEYNDYIVKNKIQHIDLPDGKAPKSMTLEKEDYEKWFRTAKKVLNPYYYSVVRLLALGERRGELLGLRYESFEKLSNEDTVRYKILFDRARNPIAKNGSDLKTTSSYRYIIANQDMNEDIENVLFLSKKIRLSQKQTIKPDDYVVVSIGTGLPMAPVYINKLFSKVSEACNIRIHPHMLRHYFATVALQNNINNISVMKWLGHAKPEMTDKYFRSNESSILAVSDEIHGKF